jgi:hypothetical protein
MAFVVAASGSALADKQELMIEAQNAAAMLRRFGDSVSMNTRFEEVSRGMAEVKACFEAIDVAIKGGATYKEEFAMGSQGAGRLPSTRKVRNQRGRWDYFTNLGLLKKHCKMKKSKVQLVRTYLALQAAYHTNNSIERAKSVDTIKDAMREHRTCVRETRRALKMKANKADITFDRPDVKLGEAEDKVCKVLAASVEEAKKRVLAATDLSKFHEVLKDDRRKVFDDNMLFGGPVFGSDKFPLKDPEDLQYSDVWYEVLTARDDFGNRGWVVRAYTFKDTKLVDTKTSRGEGEEPPKTIFK